MTKSHRYSGLIAGVSLLLAGIASAQASPVADPALVKTAAGPVRGVIHDGLREFKGIPYAQPPVGPLRWALPQPAKPWTKPLDASQFGTACPQVSRYGLTAASYDENCLTINVTAPYDGKPAKARKPVLVWIHGGAFVGGSSSLYPLGHLAKAGDMVVVSMNYRLGVFGFMPHPSFGKDYNGGYGLKDQRLALAWVKKNIAAFGGNPHNITIAGESAGAASVCMHLIAPNETRGLFEKAIVQSAGCATPLPSVADSSKTGVKVAEAAGCPDASTALDCLRRKSVKDMLDAASKAATDLMAFEPAIGAKTVPRQGAKALASGRFVHVPILNGGTRDEMRLYVAYDIQAGQKFTAENYADTIKAIYGDKAAAIVKQYPVASFSSPPAAVGTIMSDFNPDIGINNCIYLETGKLIRKFAPVYESIFADRDAPPVTDNPGFEMGAVHSSELPYYFPHFDNTTKLAGPDLKPGSQKLSDIMTAYWTSFARNGKPTAKAGVAWARFTRDKSVLRLEPGKLAAINAGQEHRCGFWKSLYPKILTQ